MLRGLLIALFCLAWPLRAMAEDLEASVVRVYSYIQKPDYDSPWTTKQSEKISHNGLIVDKHKVLVSAFAVSTAQHYEVEKIGEAKRYPLKLLKIDPVANLALMEFSEGEPEGLEDLSLGDDLELGGNCTIYQSSEGESLVARNLRMREVQLQAGVLTSYSLPQYVLEIRTSGYGWFEPLLRGGKLVGAAISQTGSTVYALPVSIMKRFIREATIGTYRQFPELGISFSSLLSPDLRTYAKAQSTEDGVWIQDVKETSAFAKDLKKGDVLLEFNDTPISGRGSYDHPLWGRISIVAKLSEIYAGDKVTLTVLRDGKEITFTEPIKAYDPYLERVPAIMNDPPHYVIFGGLVIQELTEGLLQSWGSNWRKRAPLPYLYEETFHAWPQRGGTAKLLVLQRVLPLDFTKGYHNLGDVFITEVNGQKVENLLELNDALNHPERGKEAFARFHLEPGNEEIILSYKGLEGIHRKLSARYGIPTTAQFWNPEKSRVKTQ